MKDYEVIEQIEIFHELYWGLLADFHRATDNKVFLSSSPLSIFQNKLAEICHDLLSPKYSTMDDMLRVRGVYEFARDYIKALEKAGTRYYDNLTTLRFNFNMEAVEAAGTTTEALLAPMREYAREKGISEPEYGFFTLPTDRNSYCIIIDWVIEYSHNNKEFPHYFKSIISTIDDEVEDCLPALMELDD
ncbi:hypothetical protein [Anaerovibrio sp. JC8]|uniref:hypothetical protein n=1 Tax=Anaerovibrio sp. JC8 TaxID=1240085 RepID=UPI001177F001|nr:hypothetical protein [Anaerovibrio sp. JC8]